jgi:FGGY family of carbohydrate kinases, C-terminal domain
MAKAGVYLQLFEKRENQGEEGQDGSVNGPVFGPLDFVEVKNASQIKMGTETANDELSVTQNGFVYYGGFYYGDFSVFLESRDRKRIAGLTDFDQAEAIVPAACDAQALDEKNIESILRSSAPLGHKIEDILQHCGLDRENARHTARLISRAIQNHLITLGSIFLSGGHSACAKAMMLEASSLFSD